MDNAASSTMISIQNIDDNTEEQRLNDELHLKPLSRQQIQRRHERWRIGLILLSIVIILWVASGFLINVRLKLEDTLAQN